MQTQTDGPAEAMHRQRQTYDGLHIWTEGLLTRQADRGMQTQTDGPAEAMTDCTYRQKDQ